ncbi:MAG: hypothetical protein ACMUHX_09870, partial [bacterium]
EKIEYLYDFAQMVLADNNIDPREIEVFSDLCRRLGFVEDNIPDLIDFLIEETKNGSSKENIINTIRANL